MTKMYRRPLSSAAAVAVAFSLFFSSAGSAVAATDESDTSAAPMTLVGFDREVAAANGYEIRTDNRGFEYSVPVGTPADAAPVGPFAPGPEANGANVVQRGSVSGNCGSSYVDVKYGTIFTGYSINSSYGKPVSHLWTVKLITSTTSGFYDFGGLATLGSSSWKATQLIIHGGTPQQAVAEGTVFTNNGSVCFSGAPSWP